MNETLIRDLARKAIDDCVEAINRTTDLANSRNETISIVATVGVNILNNLLVEMHTHGCPEEFLTQLLADIRESISHKPTNVTIRLEQTNV